MNIKILVYLIIIFSAYSCFREKNNKSANHPNIILIIADDMGYGDAGCYNDQSLIPTPNIDRLASEGILFTDAHSPASVCSPSRYGLLTGRYSWRTRLKSGVLIGYDETPLIEPGRNTLGSLLKESGYETACIGKWHIGLNWPVKDGSILLDDKNRWQEDQSIFRANEQSIDFTRPVTGGPGDLGFDYSFITFGCSTSDPPYVFIEDGYPVTVPTEMPPEEYIGLPGFVPGLMDPNWSQEEVDIIFTDKGIDFIETHLKKSPHSPFFLYLALSSPHIPFLVPEIAKGKSTEGPRGDLVHLVDLCLGEIIKVVEENGIVDNTLIIFTSDNGPRKGANGHKSAGNLRGYKANIWEGGHRIPFIARWPQKIDANINSDEVISFTDMFATFSELTGINDIKGGEDSYSVLSAFFGEKIEKNNDKPRVFHSSKGLFAIRKGKWKLIEGNVDTTDSEIDKGQLYNLDNDPYETRNLWDNNPDIVNDLLILLNRIKLGVL
ncbi:MAG: arylsulfatase [Bacteroidales bacterium]|nr:arylsulfatase [Bacteroidales bacterium]